MKYINAVQVLPEELIERLQDYVQGEYLYVPAREGLHKSWGERSGYRRVIDSRNQEIQKAYASGVSVEALADSFFLSVHAIRKIVYSK